MTAKTAQDQRRVAQAAGDVVVGLGRTGLSVVRHLHRAGVAVTVVDTRAEPPQLDALRRELPEVPVHLGPLDNELLARARRLVVSPGLSVHEPAIAAAAARGVEVLGDIELFAREARAPVAAITGSNGKSSVTTLLGRMAEQAGRDPAVGGNLGTPALDLLPASGGAEPGLYVLELSSFQLETTRSLAPAVAVVLNLAADHLDRYPSMEAYARAKQRIYEHARAAVINADDPVVAAMAVPADRLIRITLNHPGGANDYGLLARDGREWLARGERALLAVDELGTAGRHNVANALAALAMGDVLGFPETAMLDALKAFKGLPHRTERVARIGDIVFYNDSKGTNVGAAVAAVTGVAEPVVLIAGGQAKETDFSALRSLAPNKLRAAVVIGRDAEHIAAALEDVIPVRRARDMQAAVELAAALAEPGQAVLLSPACASFDMYRDYEERGRDFADVVRGLA